MKEEIIMLLGKKQGRTVELIDVTDYNKVHGLYHSRGDLFCLKAGEDIDFKDLDKDEQSDVFTHMTKGRFKVNNSLQ